MAGFGCGGLIIARCGELMVAGSRCGCGGLIIARCGELMVAAWISVWLWGADNIQVWGADGGWILVWPWGADNRQVWGADGGWILV